MHKKIDLHVHTKASDGIYSPVEIIDYAIQSGLSALAICDHDTVAGIPEAWEYASKIGFDLIPGVEFAMDYNAGSFHLVGLFIDFEHSELLAVTERLKKSRVERMAKMVESLNGEGYNIPLCDVEEEAKGAAVGKPHIARVMLRKGYAKEMSEIFKNFMCQGKPGYVKRDRLSVCEAVSIVKNAGGIPIVAHPISLNLKTFDKYSDRLNEFRECGVEGLEVYSSMHTINDVSEFLKIANKNGFAVSGGSDFHGDREKQIGAYADGNFIPWQILTELRSYRRHSK